jgi:hypothetical protein
MGHVKGYRSGIMRFPREFLLAGPHRRGRLLAALLAFAPGALVRADAHALALLASVPSALVHPPLCAAPSAVTPAAAPDRLRRARLVALPPVCVPPAAKMGPMSPFVIGSLQPLFCTILCK